MLVAVLGLSTTWMRQCLLRPGRKGGGSSCNLKCQKFVQKFQLKGDERPCYKDSIWGGRRAQKPMDY